MKTSNLRHFLNSLPDEKIADNILDKVFCLNVGRNQDELIKDLDDILTLRKFKSYLGILYNEILISEEHTTKQEQIIIIYKSYKKKLLDLKKGIEKLYIKYPKTRRKRLDSVYYSNEYIKNQDDKELFFTLKRQKNILINDLENFIVLFEYDIEEDFLLDGDTQENLIYFINNEGWGTRLFNNIHQYNNKGYSYNDISEITENFSFSILDIYNNIPTIPTYIDFDALELYPYI